MMEYYDKYSADTAYYTKKCKAVVRNDIKDVRIYSDESFALKKHM